MSYEVCPSRKWKQVSLQGRKTGNSRRAMCYIISKPDQNKGHSLFENTASRSGGPENKLGKERQSQIPSDSPELMTQQVKGGARQLWF